MLFETALGTLEDLRIGSDRLRVIAEGMLSGQVSKEQAAERVESLLQEYVPLKWQEEGT